MRKIMLHAFIKRIVEKGTDDRYTLLPDKKSLDEPLTIQKSMKKIIHVKNNTCGHSYEITVGEFIKNNKVCNPCLSTKISPISDGSTVIYNSLHNTQTI